ncbi:MULTISPECIES: SDR family NAD(P)-dependent oxidoreductase [Catenuloplanes]|uniref:Meso-butanediol dehydrogenase/(S,S)-butanediol dehydrogenase/diacetyl reductase n=1 Tax=Catenuloplanes niger TaxID=587534 RepID=A0AAE3ZL18_9ACTN|nr:SDR family NAD(P)-dependent oxidoreductase [Catenuloplanes niger]MDR7320646.1 meso-butanediol dehydrogenase/(S,S)-butanediol dehydrogenase/diacetyl reductase [Catenuloplanes niger]
MAEKRFLDRVALVTGGGSGMGAAIALRLAAEGATTVIAGRDPEKLSRVAERAPEGSTVIPRSVDVGDEPAVVALVDDMIERFGRLDVLVNCAGVTDIGLFADLDAKTWRDTFAVNADGLFHAARAAIPHLKATRGSIVNIGSSNALRNNYGQVAYGASKSAAENLSASIAIECGADGVRANTVHPGVIFPTGMTGQMADHPGLLESYAAHIPMRRAGTPEEIAAVVAFLASPEAGYINGASIVVDGGLNQVMHLPAVVPVSAATPDHGGRRA